MRAPTERRGARSLFVTAALAVFAVIPASARAAELAVVDAPPATPDPMRGLRLEVMGGLNAPLGNLGGAIVYQPTARLAFGVGGGVAAGESGAMSPQLGAFVRAHLWRREAFAVGPVLTLSGGERVRERTYQRPQFASPDTITYRWDPGIRMDAGLGAEVAVSGYSLRLEAGLGVYLNNPTCSYRPPSQPGDFQGSCDAPEIPEPYHFTFEPGRLAPYVSLTAAFNASHPTAPETVASQEAAGELPRQPRTHQAWLAPTALTVPAGTIDVTLVEAVLVRATFGVTDRLQLSAGAGWSGLVGLPMWNVGAKLWFVSAGRFKLALVAEHFGFRTSSYTGIVATGVGAVASVCLDAACTSVISLAGAGGWLYEDHDDIAAETTTGALISPNAVVSVPHTPVKVIVESHLPASAPRDGLWAALLRLPIGNLTIDVGAAGSLAELSDIVPAGSVGYRW